MTGKNNVPTIPRAMAIFQMRLRVVLPKSRQVMYVASRAEMIKNIKKNNFIFIFP
jgi:hypothetical protein